MNKLQLLHNIIGSFILDVQVYLRAER